MAEIIDLDPPTAKKRLISEVWVARAFAEHQAGKLAYCHSQGAWLRFDGAIWRLLEKPDVFHMLRELTAEMSAFASNATRILKASFVGGAERFAKADPIFSRKADDWDRDINLAGTPGVTVNLITGRTRAPDPNDMITKSLAVAPAEHPDCPLWLAFLEQVAKGDHGFIRYLQQMCGYALTGEISEQVLFFIYGPGGTGKTVFQLTLQGIMDGYSVTAPAETLQAHRFAQHTTDLAMMRGARLVTASETGEGAAWNEPRIKTLTGGDPITARRMHQDNCTFQPQFTLLVVGNHAPALKSVDPAVRRRFNILPFRAVPRARDTRLVERLRAEWPGILRWMIDGGLDWRAHGFVRPQVVLDETAKYFSDQDALQEWIDTRCDVQRDNPRVREKSSALFSDWKDFATANGLEPGNSKTFRPALERLGFRARRLEKAVHFFGLCLRGPAPLL